MAVAAISAMSAAFDELASQVRGELIQPGSVEFDEARRVYNQMIDR